MRVDIIATKGPGKEPETLGSAHWVPELGMVVIDPVITEMLSTITVLQPGDPSRVLTPADGEEYLRALPFEFRSGYVRAVVVEREPALS
jgi:hypothetical protein